MKKKTIAAAVAGAMTVAALAITGGGDPAPNIDPVPIAVESPQEESTFAGSMTAIEEAVNGLVDKSVERGMDIPARTENYTPGINGVVRGLDGMAPTSGTTMEVRVSKEGSLSRGDHLRVCKEFTTGATIRFAKGGVKVIAAVSNMTDVETPDVENNIAILFSQSGDTKLKTIQYNKEAAEWHMGNTVTILTGVELTAADMAMGSTGECLIAYNRDGDGIITLVECNPRTRVNTLGWTDIWMDGGDPENICMAYDPAFHMMTICCTRLPEGSTADADRYAVLVDMHPDSYALRLQSGEVPLTPEAQPGLYGIQYDTDAFAQGWDIEFAGNWYYDRLAKDPDAPVPYDYVLFVTYPHPDGDQRGIIVAENSMGGQSKVKTYVNSPVIGSVPTVAMKEIHTGTVYDHLSTVALVHGVTRLDKDNQPKSRVAVELYATLKKESKPVSLLWREGRRKYNTNISRICVGNVGPGTAYIGYANGNTMYGMLVEFRAEGTGSVMGPEINVGTFQEFATICPVDEERAAYIYQSSGDGYVRLLTAQRVVAETTVDQADGTALESGRTGETIQADMTYWPSDVTY